MNQDTHQSVYRERLLEHLSENLATFLVEHGASLEVSRPAVDGAGMTLYWKTNGITRHVQLKSSRIKGQDLF